jgi:hypothetical protein
MANYEIGAKSHTTQIRQTVQSSKENRRFPTDPESAANLVTETSACYRVTKPTEAC